MIDSLPYIKDYIDHEHPFPANPNAILLCGTGKSLGRAIQVATLYRIYGIYKTELFPKLLQDPNVAEEDKQKIKELLKKPWNPYIRSALIARNMVDTNHWQLTLHTLFSEPSDNPIGIYIRKGITMDLPFLHAGQ